MLGLKAPRCGPLPRPFSFSEEMAHSPKIEDEPDETSTADIPDAADSTSKEGKTTKGTKVKSHSRDGDSKDSPGAASAKRRCVSTACIACRKRKSKVREDDLEFLLPAPHHRLEADAWSATNSVMAIHPAVLHAPQSMAPNAFTTQIQTTVARASIRRILTTSRRATPPFKPSSKPSSITPKTKCQSLSNI